MKDVLQLKRSPDSRQLFDDVRERRLAGREENRIDRAGRNTGDDVQPCRWQPPGDAAQHADLIRRTRTSAGEHDGERAAVAVHRRRLCATLSR